MQNDEGFLKAFIDISKKAEQDRDSQKISELKEGLR